MNSKVNFIALLLGVVSGAVAGPICISGTLASYEALGSAGCTVGSTTVSGFNTPSGMNFATLISPTNISVTPSMSAAGLSLQFTASVTAANGQILEAVINYSASGSIYSSLSMIAAGTTSSGSGAVTDIQNYCLGGSFDATGVSNCATRNTGVQLLLGDGSQSATFAPAASLSITDDITFDSGGVGAANGASGGMFSDRLATAAAVPEPASFALVIAAILSIAAIRRFCFQGEKRRSI